MYMYAVINVAIYPVGVPLLFATILIKNRRALKDESRDADGELVRNSNSSLDRFAVLFDVYKPKKWWWESYTEIKTFAPKHKLFPMEDEPGKHMKSKSERQLFFTVLSQKSTNSSVEKHLLLFYLMTLPLGLRSYDSLRRVLTTGVLVLIKPGSVC